MIEQNELRIGNMVQVLGHIETVKEITKLAHTPESGIVVGEWGTNNGNVNYSGKAFASMFFVEPIPITEEILLNFGFKQWDVESENLIGYHSAEPDFFRINYYKENSFEHGGWIPNVGGQKQRKIKYIHELQNSYFAFTGNELNYKYGWKNVKVMIDGKEIEGINSIEYISKRD